MSTARRFKRAKTNGRIRLTDRGRDLVAWMIAGGMPVPEATDLAWVAAAVAAVAVVDGETVSATPDAPGGPMLLWMQAHKDELAVALPIFMGESA